MLLLIINKTCATCQKIKIWHSRPFKMSFHVTIEVAFL